MTDAILLKKTKSRLLGLQKLKDLAVETILQNLDALSKKQGGNYMQKKLSPELRDVVLQELLLRSRCLIETNTTDLYIEKKRILCVLMNTRTKILDLDYLMSFHPRRMTTKDEFYQVLMMVSIAAPNVRHLKINIKNILDCFSSDFTRDACIRFLSFLKELRILEIVGWSHIKVDVALLCKALPDLRVFSVKKIDLFLSTMSKEEIRKSFGHLTLLEYDFSSSDKMCQIWKTLPNLEIVQNVRANGLNLEDFIEDENLQTRGRKCLDSETYLLYSEVFADADFSSIRHLKFSYSEEKRNTFEKILKWPITLESLNLNLWNESEIVDDILLKFGANIRWLSITGICLPSLQLDRISDLCPKLEVLHLRGVKVTGNSSKPAKFGHLEELVFEQTECMTGECLTTLFSSARNLQMVMLHTSQHNLEDLQKVKNLLIENKILSSLKSLEWKMSSSTPDRDYKEIAAIVSNAAAGLPELRNLKLSYQRSYRSGHLNAAEHVDKNLNEILKSFIKNDTSLILGLNLN